MTTVSMGKTLNNSDSKCLLENWVEERNCKELGFTEKSENNKLIGVAGHPGTLTINISAEPEKISTCKDTYRNPQKNAERLIGKKKESLEKFLYQKFGEEVHEEFNPPPEPVEYRSVTKKDFDVEGFVSIPPEPLADHDVANEQPITFWSQHKNKIHGVSQQKTLETPFKKNDAFSKPVEDQFNKPAPYELENYPFM